MLRDASMEISADTLPSPCYCFSPATVGTASEIGPAIVGAWGGFGLIFTSIAVAHTLYAPREVVLWNWRRILLMGLSIAICVGRAIFLLDIVAAGAAVHVVGGTCAAAARCWSSSPRRVARRWSCCGASIGFRPVVFFKALRRRRLAGNRLARHLSPGLNRCFGVSSWRMVWAWWF